MKKHVAIIGLCAVIAAGAGGVAAQQVQGAKPAPRPQTSVPAIPVVAEKVKTADTPLVMSGIGSVEAYNVVNVRAQVTGTIDKIGFVEGQTVHPGSLIAQLDPRPYQAALQQAEANLARDQANLTNAQTDLGRYVPLARQGYAAAQQVADQTSVVNQLQATVLSDRAAIFNAQTQLGYTTIDSPIDGVTGIRHVDIGNILQPASTTPIVTITQVQPISVVFTLPQKDVPAVQAAMAKGPLQTIAYGQDDRTELGQGTLLMVDNTINQSSGTVQLKATFPNAKKALWPGEFVNVRLTVAVRHDGISVPLSALQQGQTGDLVYVVQPDGVVRERPVAVAQTLNGRALIDHGLTAGETVVTAGQYRLSDGVKVSEVSANDPQVQNSTEASAGML
ncbi:MAG TPA: efflux RND transporter periplasmic adaptor subunit [Acetobacteraceae bacterium]|nr:efflux RND transporter periplasmic adaptor subunit [Acetobacteraceae bacterium]